MSALQLVETDVNLIDAWLQANIAAALTEISVYRGDNFVSMEPPHSYFHFPNAKAYRAPAVFIVPEDGDFKLSRGQNSIDMTNKINVAVVCEDKDSYRLTVKVWRYQAALTKLLYLTPLQTGDASVKIVTKVVRHVFSDIYPKPRSPGDPEQVFRKEVVVQLEVEHYENVTN